VCVFAPIGEYIDSKFGKREFLKGFLVAKFPIFDLKIILKSSDFILISSR
jgi:hypothetical protein